MSIVVTTAVQQKTTKILKTRMLSTTAYNHSSNPRAPLTMAVPRFFSLVCFDAVLVPDLPDTCSLELQLDSRTVRMQRIHPCGPFVVPRQVCGKAVYLAPVFATADLARITLHAVDSDDGVRIRLPMPSVDTHGMLLAKEREFCSPGSAVQLLCRPVYRSTSPMMLGLGSVVREAAGRARCADSVVTTHLEQVFAAEVKPVA